MMEQLIPCKLCNSKEVVLTWFSTDEKKYYDAQCNGCHIETDWAFDSQEKVIKKWNTLHATSERGIEIMEEKTCYNCEYCFALHSHPMVDDKPMSNVCGHVCTFFDEERKVVLTNPLHSCEVWTSVEHPKETLMVNCAPVCLRCFKCHHGECPVEQEN